MTIDERLEFLLQSTESLHATTQQTVGMISDLTRGVNELSEAVLLHEERWERVRRVVGAALRAYLDENGAEPEGGNGDAQ